MTNNGRIHEPGKLLKNGRFYDSGTIMSTKSRKKSQEEIFNYSNPGKTTKKLKQNLGKVDTYWHFFDMQKLV